MRVCRVHERKSSAYQRTGILVEHCNGRKCTWVVGVHLDACQCTEMMGVHWDALEFTWIMESAL